MPIDYDELANKITDKMIERGQHTTCPVFDAKTVEGIKNMVRTYEGTRNIALKIGGAFAVVVIAAFATGFVWMLWEGFKVFVHKPVGGG